MNELKTVSDNLDFGKEHIRWNTTIKVYDPVNMSHAMMFKLEIRVYNGANDWNIYVWSPVSYSWNSFASKHDIGGLECVSYISCMESGTKNINPGAIKNHELMVKYVKDFCKEV